MTYTEVLIQTTAYGLGLGFTIRFVCAGVGSLLAFIHSLIRAT